jgi:hypothetical protein
MGHFCLHIIMVDVKEFPKFYFYFTKGTASAAKIINSA